MAGLAIVFDEHQPVSHADFSGFLEMTASLKHIEVPAEWAVGGNSLGAKLDAPCSLHRGVFHDPENGSWLLAAGTIIDSLDIHPGGSLGCLLQDYLSKGTTVLSRLDGQFALAIFDARQNTVSLISDPFGLVPLYYGQAGGRWYISTSAIAVAKVLHSKPDLLRARAFLLYGDLLGGSLWQDVHLLSPASVLILSQNGATQRTYWSFDIDPGVARHSEKEAIDCMLESFSQSMICGLKREGKIWISLTGGLDSRMLAALTVHSRLPFKTYCHGPRDSRDVTIAELISRLMDWDYEYFPLPLNWGSQRVEWLSRAVEQTDGELNTIKLTRTIREQIVKSKEFGVSMWGYGGEIYRGCYWKQEFWNAGITSQVNYERLMDFRLHPFDDKILSEGSKWKKVVQDELVSQFRKIGENQPTWPNTVKLDLIALRMERQACGGTVAAVLGQQRVLLPFNFKENLRRAISINFRWRTHSRLFRTLLERINPKLAEIGTADGSPALPLKATNLYRFLPYWLDESEKLFWKLGYKYLGKALWTKSKAGQEGKAYPEARWLQDTLSEIQEVVNLDSKSMLSAGIYDQGRLKKILERSVPWNPVYETLISQIITLEIALGIVGIGF